MQPALGPRHHDPLRFTQPLPIETEFYPMGFPLRIATNHEAALAAARHTWSRCPKLFDPPPIRIAITVDDDSRGEAPQDAPILRGQGNLLTIVASRDNFAAADLNGGFGHICVSRAVASDAAYFRYHFLEPLAYVLISSRHAAFVHASCVALDGHAVILSGASGSGKTCLAYECARRGWAFLSGDAVAVLTGRRDNRIVGRPHEIRFRRTAARLFPELAEFPRVLRPSGKTDIEADPADLNLRSAVEGAASHLVFLNRVDAEAGASLDPLSSQQARLELEEGICFGDHSVRERHGLTLDRLAQLPAFRLHYSDLARAERALRALVMRGAKG